MGSPRAPGARRGHSPAAFLPSVRPSHSPLRPHLSSRPSRDPSFLPAPPALARPRRPSRPPTPAPRRAPGEPGLRGWGGPQTLRGSRGRPRTALLGLGTAAPGGQGQQAGAGTAQGRHRAPRPAPHMLISPHASQTKSPAAGRPGQAPTAEPGGGEPRGPRACPPAAAMERAVRDRPALPVAVLLEEQG